MAAFRDIPLITVLVAVVLVCPSCGEKEHTEAGTMRSPEQTYSPARTYSPSTARSGAETPNILFILTDDQDPESLNRMDSVQRLLVRQGVVSDELVANIDLAPTIAAWAGIEPPDYVDGRSLVPLLEGTATSWRRWLLFEHFALDHPYAGVRSAGGESYVEYENGEKEYYELRVDPWQLRSAHAVPENAERLAQLSEIREDLEDCEGAGCRAADVSDWQEYTTGPTRASRGP